MIHERALLRICQHRVLRYSYSKEAMRDDLSWYLPRRIQRSQGPNFHWDVSILFRAPYRDIAMRYPVMQCVAKRNRREHKYARPSMAAPQTQHQNDDGSRHQIHLRAPQQYASQLLRMEDVSRGVPQKDTGGNRP